MNASRDTITKAVGIVMRHAMLPMVRSWWHYEMTYFKYKPFGTWLRSTLDRMAGQVKSVDPSPCEIVKALGINACGVPLAEGLAHESRELGFKADTDSYVEGGIVYVSICLKGYDAVKRAKSMKKDLVRMGWAVDLCCEGAGGEMTVNSSLDFSAYGNGGAVEATW